MSPDEVLQASRAALTTPKFAAPDFGAEVPDNAATLLADRVAQLRTFLDTPNASITLPTMVGALKLLTRVVLWLVRRSV